MDDIKLMASGWAEAIGTTSEITTRRFVSRLGKEKKLYWELIQIDDIKLAKTAALLIVQGMPLSGLFPPDLAFCRTQQSQVLLAFSTPIILLGRKELSLLSSSPKLSGVQLGVVVGAWEMSEEEILAVMVEYILSA